MRRILATLVLTFFVSFCALSQVVITSPSGGSIINDAQDNALVISGTATWTPLTNGNNLTVTISDGTNTVQTTIPIASNWSTGALNLASGAPGPLVEGTNNLTIDAVTDGLTALNATDVIVSYDKTAPNGYSVTLNQDPVLVANETAVSFTFAGAEVGSTYNYSISSTGGGGPIVGSNTIATATDVISGINISALNNGTLTLSVILTDVAGNPGIAATDNAAYDGTRPTFVSARYYDTDTNGNIDEVLVQMSEPITDGSITLGNFSLAGVAPSSVSASIQNPDDPQAASDEYITFEVSISGTGVPVAATSYTAGTLVGVDGNAVSTNASITEIDAALPLLTARSPLDDATGVALNTDITLTFSENVSAGTGNISIVDISGSDDRTIPVGDGQIGFSTNTLTIDPSSDLEYFTEYAINVASTAVTDGTNNFAGLAGTTAFSFTTIGEVPTYTATWLDNSGNGTIDRLRLNFSIPVVVTDADGAGGGLDVISLGGGLTIGNANYSGTTSQLDLIVNGVTSGTADPSVSIQYSTAGTSTIVASDGGQEIPNTATPTSTTDGAAPIVLQSITLDANLDGVVDAMEIEFSEPMDDSDFSGGGYANWTLNDGSGAEVFTGFNTQVSVLASANAEDEYVRLTINTGIVGTGSMNYAYSGSSISDLAGVNNLAAISSTTADDGAEPRITSFEYQDNNSDRRIDQFLVLFSEPITAASTFNSGNLSITNDGDFNSAQFGAGVDLILGTTSSVVVPLTTISSVDDTRDNSGALAISTTGVFNLTDGINTYSTTEAQTWVTFEDGAAALPLLAGSEYLDTDLDGTVDRIDVTFTEDISTSSFEGGDWVTTGGGGITETGAGFSADVIQIDVNVTNTNSTALGVIQIQYSNSGTPGSIVDASGNITGLTGSITVADGAAPVIISAEYRDNDDDGRIDRFFLTFSEEVAGASNLEANDLSLTVGDFTGAAFGTDNTDLIGANTFTTEVILGTEASAVDTEENSGAIAIATQNSFSLVDISAGANTNTFTGARPQINFVDGAAPVIASALYQDTDLNGAVDRVAVTFSEDITGSSFEAGDWTFPANPHGLTPTFGSVSSSIFNISVGNGPADNTALTATTIQYNDLGSTGSITDGTYSSVTSISPVSVGDGAAPVIIDFTYEDNNEDGAIDRFILTYSESVAAASQLSANDLNLTNVGDFSDAAFGGSTSDLIGSSTTSTTVPLGTPASVQDTYDGSGSLAISSQNAFSLSDGTNVNTSLGNQFQASFSDGAAPVMILATTYDWNADGEIDSIGIVISEPVDDTSLSGSTFNVLGYSGEDAVTGDVADDNKVAVTFNQSGGPDTDVTPAVTLNSGELYDEATVPNSIGSNQTGLVPTDGAIPIILLGTNPSPEQDENGVNVSDARTITFSYSEDINANALSSIYIYNTTDLINPIVQADVTDAEVSIVGPDITWNHGVLLDKGQSFVMGIEAGAFTDDNGLNSAVLPNVGDGRWKWNMQADGDPNFVYSPQDALTNVAPFARIYFYFDEPVRIQNSSDTRLEVDIIDNYADNNHGADQFVVDVDNYYDPPGDGTSNEIDNSPNHIPSFILPLHQVPCGPPYNCDPAENYTKEKIFDISEISGYNSDNGYIDGEWYELRFRNNCFEDRVDDNDASEFIIKFQIDATDAVRPFVNSFFPADDPSSPATITVNPTITSLTINFNETVVAGYGNIKLYANLSPSPDVEVLNIASNSSLVDIVGSVVTIDISGITLSGNVEYYVNIDKGAFTDVPGNTNVGFSDKTTWNFITEPESNAPEISSLLPVDNATGVDVNSDLTIFFNEPVKEGSGGNLYVRLSSNGYIVETIPSSSFSFNGNEVTVTLSQLGGLSGYYVNIENTAISDLGNNAFPGITGSFAWSFTTASEAVAPAGITSTFSPADGSSGAAVSTNISFYFDEVVSPITGNNITIYRANDDALIEQFDVTDPEILVSGNQVIINPTSDLSFLTEYYVVVDAGAFEDASGNLSLAVGGDGNWNFTTGADASNPFIVTLSPSDNATGISLTPVITIGFSESVVDQGSGVVNLLYTDGSLAHQLSLGDFDFSDDLNPSIDLNVAGVTLSGNTEYFLEIPNTSFEDLSGLPFAGVAGNGNWSFTTTSDAADPVPVGSPTGSGVTVSTDLILTFPEPVTANTGNITVRYNDISGTIVETIDVATAEPSTGNTVYTIELSNNLSGGVEYYIDVDDGAFVDNSGNTSTGLTGSTDWNFTTNDDGVAPNVVSLTPANDATGVSTASASLVLTFNEPVALGSGNITMAYKDGVVIQTFTTGQVTLSNGNTTATVTAYSVLDGLTEYYVSVDNGFFVDSDASPNVFPGITGNGSWSFITGGDAVAPTASGGVTPANGTTGNPVDPTITITMNERVYAGSGVITVSGGGQTVNVNVLDGTQITGFGTNVISIDPTESLINGVTYTVTVPAGAIEDPSGNPNALLSWSFSVGNATIVTASNTIICTNQDYVALNDLTITETANTDFLVGTDQTLVITLPAQFEFNTALTPSVDISGGDLTAGSAVVDFNTLTITYTTDGQSGGVDEIVVSNLEAKYIGISAGIYNALRTGGTGNMKGNNVVHGQPHFVFDVNDPPSSPTLSATALQVNGTEDFLEPADVAATTVTATGVGNITWYNNDFSVSTAATSGVALAYTSLPGLNPDNSFGTFDLASDDHALYTYYATDHDGTCESDPIKRNILVRGYGQTPSGNSFVDDAGDIRMAVTQPTNHLVTFTGDALFGATTSGDSAIVNFSPSTAGNGDHDILIKTSNTLTTESLTYTETFSVAATAQIFDTPLDIDYCQDAGTLNIDPLLTDITANLAPTYSFYGMYLDGVLITPPPGWSANSITNPTTGWVLDLSGVSPGPHKIQRRVCVALDPILYPPSTYNYVYLQADLDVYPVPTVEFINLPDYLCEDGLTINLDVSITNPELIGKPINTSNISIASYQIEKTVGVGSGGGPIAVGSDLLDPSDPLGDGTDPVGTYLVTYTSLVGDDPNFPSQNEAKGCGVTITKTINIQAVPERPVFTNDFSGIGGENVIGDRLNLQFCIGDLIPNITANLVGSDSIIWYKNSTLTTTYNSTGTRGNILDPVEIFGTNTPNSAFDINIYVTKTDYINAGGSGFEGCESPPKIINIRVYEDPFLASIDVTQDAATQLSTTSYLFEYCDTYGSENVTFNSSLPDGEAYYRLYNNKKIYQQDWPSNTLEFLDFGFAGTPGTDTTIYVGRVLNDSTNVDPNGEFGGCESGLMALEVRVYETSPAPDTNLLATGRPDYYICSGDNLGTITSPGEQDTRYAWYPDDGSGMSPNYAARMDVAAFDDRFIVQNEFDGFSNVNTSQSDTTYVYWITQFQDYNDETGYVGCESEPSKITITVFPDPGPPEFSVPVSSHIYRNPTDIQFLEASYCKGQITGTESFILNGNTDAIFNWYRADPIDSTAIGNAVHSHDATQPVTSSQLKITDSEQDTIYFVVTQVNNSKPNGADFDGCETEVDSMAFVTLYIYDIPLAPTTIDNDYTYCEDAVWANGITVQGEAGVTFYWYRDDDDDGNQDQLPFFNGSFATATDLGLLNQNGTGSYSFWVTQTQDSTSGVATFAGCESPSKQITVFEVPPQVSISYDDFTVGYIPSSSGYCVDQLSGTVSISYAGVPNATFAIYDASLNLVRPNSPDLFYNTGQQTVGTYTYYITQTLNNCESDPLELTFNIYQTPVIPEFELVSNATFINPQYEFIYCKDQDISVDTLKINNGQVGNTYEWYFDASLNESITQNINEVDQYVKFVNLGVTGVDIDEEAKTPGTYSRYVRSKESNECYSPVRRFDLVVGEAPQVAFKWNGLSENEPISFTMINENPAVLAADINEVRMTVESLDIPYHEFAYNDNDTYDTLFDAGSYTVELFMRTSEVCRDSVTRTVTVLPLIDVPANGLLETFDNPSNPSGGWFAEYRTLDGKLDTLVNSWEVGTPSPTNTIINSAFSGDNVWMTNLDGDYNPDEISWVYSPAFDISALTIPIVSFYHQHWFFNSRDAVVFQYSSDNGNTWQELGELNEIGTTGIIETSGRSWYTHDEIPTQPGYYNVNSIQPVQSYNQAAYGWADAQGSLNNPTSEWLLSINKMDNAAIVIFRFALASSGGDEEEGFAFDDFRIYNSDKITLLESFYNASETGTVSAYEDLENQVDDQSVGSIAWINYFTDLDMSSSTGRDEINRTNSADPSARVGYYGIEKAPRSVIEGEVQRLPTVDQSSQLGIRGFAPAALGVAGLESKKFDITNFQLDASAPSDVLRVSATFIAVQDFPDPTNEFSIRFVVIEKEVTGVNVGEFTTSDVIRNVMRKILPNPGGIVKQGAMSQGTSFTETVEWKISGVYDPTKLDVIAFIQNENANVGRREVYQAAVLNGDFSNKELILGVLDQLQNGDPFVIYPNPVDDEFKLEILNPVREEMNWKIFDQTGKEVLRGTLPGGEISVDINTQQLPSGVFLLQLIHQDVIFEPKRIMVLHE
ncbi:MAG: Ig-like domain-containing protein [Bacteroidota bacterium]